MKKNIFFVIGILIAGSCGFTFADQGGYTISKYNVDMELNTGGTMHVTENITAHFSESRHGIYREIPIVSNNRNILITNLTTSTDPIAENDIIDGKYTLKIGDASQTVIGDHFYTISYDVLNPITSFETSWAISQELYRNVIGDNRNTSIQNVSFSIKLPTSKRLRSKEMFIVYGPDGAKRTTGAYIQQKVSTNINWGLTNITLNPKEGVTVGLQFGSGYFILPAGYEELGQQVQSTSSSQSSSSSIGSINMDTIMQIIWFVLFVGGGAFGGIKKLSKWIKTPRSSKKAITVYYTPPKNLEPADAFWFRYNNNNPRIFSALVYYRATKWWIKIEDRTEKYLFGLIKLNGYHLIETNLRPLWATVLDDQLFQSFFGIYDNQLDDVQLNETIYKKVENIFDSLEDRLTSLGLTEKSWLLGLFTKLTPQGEEMFEQLRGYKEFLEKVERPVIEAELKNDPDYINKILPWIALFGLETKMLARIEDLLQEAAKKRYNNPNGGLLNVAVFSAMSTRIGNSSVAPRASSGFGWWGGSSWWGGGWGGWGSR